MQIKTTDGERNVASQGLGVWGAVGGGLGTLALLNQGILGGGGLFGGLNNRGVGAAAAVGMTDAVSNHDTRVIGALQAELAREKSERYADNVGIDVYKAGVERAKELVADANSNYKALASEISDLKTKAAVETQRTNDNFNFINYKIDTVEKDLRQDINCKTNALRCYVDATFVPGELKMPLDKICPEAMRRYNSWTAPTNQAPDTQPVDVNNK